MMVRALVGKGGVGKAPREGSKGAGPHESDEDAAPGEGDDSTVRAARVLPRRRWQGCHG
jgi:hypothetical protein